MWGREKKYKSKRHNKSQLDVPLEKEVRKWGSTALQNVMYYAYSMDTFFFVHLKDSCQLMKNVQFNSKSFLTGSNPPFTIANANLLHRSKSLNQAFNYVNTEEKNTLKKLWNTVLIGIVWFFNILGLKQTISCQYGPIP